jgi:hypothetical protein
VLKAVTEREPRSPRSLRDDLPVAVEAIVQKAMAKDPARRYGSALELAEDLERHLRGERVQARLPGPFRRTLQWARHRPLPATLLVSSLLFLAGAMLFVEERHQNALARGLADAERLLAVAATDRDDQDRPRTRQDRDNLLLQAIGAASTAIARDESFAPAWLVRARAHHRLRQFADAIFDLDTVERLRGGAAADLLLHRIEALRQLGDANSARRLQQDLTTLLRLDPSPHTRALVAELLLDFAQGTTGHERREALARAHEVLVDVGYDDPRAAVAHARLLELGGDVEPALAAMRAASQRHQGNLWVHLEAARMFDRNDLMDEAAREHELARQGEPEQKAGGSPVDLQGFERFLGDVDRVLRTLDTRPAPTAPEPVKR